MTHEGATPEAGPPAKDRDLTPAMIVAAIIVVLAAIFIFQNTASSDVSFLWLDLVAPTWVWFFILFLVGVAVGWFAHLTRVRRAAKRAA